MTIPSVTTYTGDLPNIGEGQVKFDADMATLLPYATETLPESINATVAGMNAFSQTLGALSNVILNGTGEPSVIVGQDGNYYIQLETGDLWYKAGGAWTLKGNLKAFSNPNHTVDGNLDHWFEATSQTTSGYGSDTMSPNIHIGSTKTHSRQTFALGETDGWDAPATYYSRTAVTSVAGVGNYVCKTFIYENVRLYSGRAVTFTFRGKADAAKPVAVEAAMDFGTGGAPSAPVTGIDPQKVNLTTSWAKNSVTISLPSLNGKSLGSNDNSYLAITVWFDAGSSFNARTQSLGQQSGTFDLAQVKLDNGSIATPFVAPDPAEELARVQRYYNTGLLYNYTWGATNNVTFPIMFPVKMRGFPVGVVKSLATLTAGTVRQLGAGVDRAATITLNTDGGLVENTAAYTGPDKVAFIYTADARL